MKGKTTLAVVVSSVLALGLLVTMSSAGAAGEAIVCHATASAENPYNLLVVDSSSTVFEGHLSHENDIIAENPTEEQLAEAKDLVGSHASGEEIAEFCLSLTTTTTTAEEEPPEEPPAAPPAEPVTGEAPFTG